MVKLHKVLAGVAFVFCLALWRGTTPPANASALGGVCDCDLPPADPEAPVRETTDDRRQSGVLLAGVESGIDAAAGANVSGAEPPGDKYHIDGADLAYDMKQGLVLARGNVTFSYGDFIVHGDRGVVDYNNNKAVLSGHLTVTATLPGFPTGQEIHGHSLVFDLDTEHWTLTQLDITFPPTMFPPGTVLSPLYVKGAAVTGDGTTASGNDFKFTSCDRDDYYISAKHIDFYLDADNQPDRLVLRHDSIYVLGKKILSIPVYVISLKSANSRRIGLQPVVGQNALDGLYVKSLYTFSATENHTDSLMIDAMQYRGLGLGIQRELADGSGLFYLYELTSSTGGREIDSQVKKDWHITPKLNSSFNFQSTTNNNFGDTVTTQDSTLTFNFQEPKIQSDLAFHYNDSSSPFNLTSTLGSTLNYHQQFNDGLKFDTTSLLARNTLDGATSSETLDNTLTVSDHQNLFDTYLKAELHNDLTGENDVNGAYQLERLPELGFSSDTSRLGSGLLNRYAPGDLSFSLGEYNEPATDQELSRADFLYKAKTHPVESMTLGSIKSTLSLGGSFEQAFYSDDTARYTYDEAVNWDNKMGKVEGQLNYSTQRTLGYTPFQFDYLTPYKQLDGTLSYISGSKFRFNLSAGRDILNDFSDDVVGSVQFQPTASFYASLGTSYSPSDTTLGDIIGNVTIQGREKKVLGGKFSLGVRYTPTEGKITQSNLTADILATRKTRVEALTSYDGYTNTLSYTQVRITQDLHCFNLFVTYDQSLKELRFDLALKAFPYADTRYGQGIYGQGQGGGIGGQN